MRKFKELKHNIEMTCYEHQQKTADISILVLVHNSPKLTLKTLWTLKKTENVQYETIVLDNASDLTTKILLKLLFFFGYIDKLVYSPENTFFAAGNNIASEFANEDTKYYLLLNSDIKIIRKDWLKKLKNNHKYGISSIGICDIGKKNERVDGYCFLIDKDLYDKYKLDENFKWFYGITKLTINILKEPDCTVQGYKDKSNYIKHYWGGSGTDYKKVLNRVSQEEMGSWFEGTKKVIISEL